MFYEPEAKDFNDIGKLFNPVSTQIQNDSLIYIPSSSEIKEASWDMHPVKAPGLNEIQTFSNNIFGILLEKM